MSETRYRFWQCLCSALLLCGSLGCLVQTAQADEAAAASATPAMPELHDIYILSVTTYRDGEMNMGGLTFLSDASLQENFGSFDRRTSADGSHFEVAFDAIYFAELLDAAGNPRSLMNTAELPPATLAALQQTQTVQLGPVRLRTYVPGNGEVQLDVWHFDATGLSPEILDQRMNDYQANPDANGDGDPDPPGDYLGRLRWKLSCPDLGYVQDTPLTPEELLKMNFGVQQPQ